MCEINKLPHFTLLPNRVVCFLVFVYIGNLYLGSKESQRWNDCGDVTIYSKCYKHQRKSVCTAVHAVTWQNNDC